MRKQLSFTDLEQSTKKKQTRRKIFLAEMDKIMPWGTLEAAIEPFLSQTWQWPSALSLIQHAAHLLSAAVICPA